MNYWWVNHGKNFNMENHHGYLIAPKNGHYSWEIMENVKKGDFVFSYARRHIHAIGIFNDDPVILKKHPHTDETSEFWYVKVSWVNLNSPFKTSKIWEQTKHLFNKCKYSPLTKNGKGCQGYLYQITFDIFQNYCKYIQKYYKIDINRFINGGNEKTIEIPIGNEDTEYLEDKEDLEDTDIIDGIAETNFTYERDLQSALIQQIDKLFPEHTIFGGNNVGREYSIDGKRIDVLLEDKSNNELLVIELKAGLAKKDVFGQIAEYIGKLIKVFPDKKITGIIIAGEIDEGLNDACRPFPNIKTMKYKIELSLIE